MQKSVLNRRGFLQAASIVAVGTAAAPASLLASRRPRSGMAIVGSVGHASHIRLYEVRENSWTALQEIPSKAPVSMLLHPDRQSLYVLNQIDLHDGLPRGTVEAYRFQRATGDLALLCRQPLSLSATGPRNMALSPDGASLVVAVAGGGAYNVLPILEDRQLGRVSIQRKETGGGPLAGHQDFSHPQSVVFIPDTNTMIATDLGSDRLSLFSIEQGMELTARLQLPQGSGPRNMAIHPDGNLLFVDHALQGALSVFKLNGATLAKSPEETLLGPFGDALAMHPSGDYLYTAGRGTISVWRIHASVPSFEPKQLNNRLRLQQSIAAGPVNNLVIDPNGPALFASTLKGVIRIEIVSISGLLEAPYSVASMSDAYSIVLA